MNGDLQTRLNPPKQMPGRDYSAAKVKPVAPDAVDGGEGVVPETKTSFKDLLLNSNADVQRAHAAQKNGSELQAAKTDDEFARLMQDQANKQNNRVPQSKLDKDSFLKLFITQMQNQDPLNPDKSSEMASQLAQFDGLEQMLNVNKNLEKMAAENASSRAMSMVDFVGKDIKLDGGKLKFAGGKLTDSQYEVEQDTPNAVLEVRDAAGVVVSTKQLGMLTKGEHNVDWDGKGTDGKQVHDGAYTFAVVAKDLHGQEVPVRVTSNVRVTGVDLHDAGGAFYTEVGKVGIGEVASVGNTGFNKKAAEAVKTATQAVKPGTPEGDEAKSTEQVNAADAAKATEDKKQGDGEPAKSDAPKAESAAKPDAPPSETPLTGLQKAEEPKTAAATRSDPLAMPTPGIAPGQGVIEIPVPANLANK